MKIKNIGKHFRTITEHKVLVMKECFKLGLYRQGLLHDLSKYSFSEFWTGVKYYQGNRSPNAAEREELGYSAAWLHHKGRNKHHFEYWIDFSADRSKGLVGNKMPLTYVAEMVCDRIAACKVYRGRIMTARPPGNIMSAPVLISPRCFILKPRRFWKLFWQCFGIKGRKRPSIISGSC